MGIRFYDGDDGALLAGLRDGRFDAINTYETTSRPYLDVVRGEFATYAVLPAKHAFDVVAGSFLDLAGKLDCQQGNERSPVGASAAPSYS